MFKFGKNRDNHFDEKSDQFIIYGKSPTIKNTRKIYDLKNKYI